MVIVEYNSVCSGSYFSSARSCGEPVYELQFDQERETKIRDYALPSASY